MLLLLGVSAPSASLVMTASSASADPPRTTVAAAHATLPNPHHDLIHHADFRVRTQSAEILGDLRDEGSRPVLELALRDAHPSVRTAAILALGKIARPESAEVLRRVQRSDASAAVRAQCGAALRSISEAERAGTTSGAPAALPASWNGVRYVFLVGESHDRAETQDATNVTAMRAALERSLGNTRGAFLASELSPALRTETTRRHIPVYRLDGTIASVGVRAERGELLVRSEVRLMLLDGLGNSILGSLSGAASAAETERPQMRDQRRRLAHRTIHAAVESALAQLPASLGPSRTASSRGQARARTRAPSSRQQ